MIVFMHPDAANVVTENSLKVRGDLVNIVGMPLETTVFLTHMIFDGTRDRFPGTKNLRGSWRRLSAFLQWKNGSSLRGAPQRGLRNKKKPSEYLKTQILVDSMVFSREGIRHLVAEMGASQVVYGRTCPR